MVSPFVTIIPWSVPLDAVTALKKELKSGLKRVKPDSESYWWRGEPVINWGNSVVRFGINGIINPPPNVAIASDKLRTFLALDTADVNTVEFTVKKNVVEDWLKEGNVVFARTLLRASGGRGIIQLEGNVVVPEARLYTKYKKKIAEYRVHVWGKDILDVQWKRKSHEGVTETRIRNHDNGWVFCREGLTEPNDLRTQAVAAVEVLGLHFGAVDIIYNAKDNKSYVLEVNTAPGLTGTTVQKYAEKIQSILKEQQNGPF